MKDQEHRSFWRRPTFQVPVTWGWNLIGTFVVSAIVALALPANIALDRSALVAQPRLALIPILSEVVLVGLLPVLFVLLGREPAAQYGLTRKRLPESLLLSAAVVLLYFSFLSLRSGQLTTSVTLPGLHGVSPGHLLLAVVALLAYGPLEVFFVLWLVHNMDRIFHSEGPLLSKGLIVTIAVYGLLHSFSQGFNALVIALEMLALALVFKRTRNAIGPMLAFVLMNEYAWFLTGVLLP